MSRKRFAKLKITKIITGFVVVGLIVFGVYLAWKNDIFASTSQTGCKITASITESTNMMYVYGVDKANFDKAKQLGTAIITLFHLANNGNPREYTSSADLYFVAHKEGGTVIFDNTPVRCDAAKNVTVNANLVQGTISHKEESIDSPASESISFTNGSEYCITHTQTNVNDWSGTFYFNNNIFNLKTTSSGSPLATLTLDQFNLGQQAGRYSSKSGECGQAITGSGTLPATNQPSTGIPTAPGNGPGDEAITAPATQITSSSLSCKFYNFPDTSIQGSWYAQKNGKWFKIVNNAITTEELSGNYSEPPPGTANNAPSICSGSSTLGTEDPNANIVPGENSVADGARRCIKQNDKETWYVRKNKLWVLESGATTNGGLSDSELNKLLNDPSSKCATGSDPLPTTQTDAEAEAPKPIIGAPRNPVAPVAGKPDENSATQKIPTKLNFTAYRESLAEKPNGIVAMGGVRFRVSGYTNNRLTGAVPPISDLKAKAGKNGIIAGDEAQCSRTSGVLEGLLGRFNDSYSKEFTTSDHGPSKVFTQTVNVPPGFYVVTFNKPNFDDRGQRICFQVTESDSEIDINVLLYAEPGAEPPGLSSQEIGQIWYDDSVNGQQEYKVKIGDYPYKYMPLYPWQGWQPDNGQYITNPPVGYTANGYTIPGLPPYNQVGDIASYISQCQNLSGLNPGIDKNDLPWYFAILGFVDGLGGNKNDGDLDWGRALGQGAAGALAGWALSELPSGDSGYISYNTWEINRQCEALLNTIAPPQCRIYFYNNFDERYGPPECISYIPGMKLFALPDEEGAFGTINEGGAWLIG